MVTEMNCPTCGRLVDCHDGIDDPTARPSAGDVSICWDCRCIAVYTEIMADPRVLRALGAVAEAYTPHEAVDLIRGARDPRCTVTAAPGWRERALAAEAQLAALGVPRGQVPYDRDPEVLAWARAHVLRCAELRRSGRDTYHVERAKATTVGRQVAAAMLRDLVDGGTSNDGAVFLGAFDARKPQLSAELAGREAAS